MRIMVLLSLSLLSYQLHAADASAAQQVPTSGKKAVKPVLLPEGVTVIDTLEYMRQPPYGYTRFGIQPARSVAWLDENHILAGVHASVVLYDKNSKERTTLLKTGSLISVLASAQNRIIAGYGGQLDIMNAEGQLISKYHDVGEIRSLSVSDDGEIIATGGYSHDLDYFKSHNMVSLYDSREKKAIKTYKMTDTIMSVAVSADHKKIAIGSGCQVDYGDIGSILQVRTGSNDTNKAHSFVQAVCFTQEGGLYSGDNGGLLVCPMDEETKYYLAAKDGHPVDDQYHPWISGLVHRASSGLCVLANRPGIDDTPMVTRRKDGQNSYFDLSGENLNVCASSKAGELAVVGSKIIMIKNQE